MVLIALSLDRHGETCSSFRRNSHGVGSNICRRREALRFVDVPFEDLSRRRCCWANINRASCQYDVEREVTVATNISMSHALFLTVSKVSNEFATSDAKIMSLSSTSTIKGQLVASLGSKSNEYFETLQQFVAGKISRTEFEDGVNHILNAPNLSTSTSSTSLP